jgi:lipid-binding SYLF domain-containing protein
MRHTEKTINRLVWKREPRVNSDVAAVMGLKKLRFLVKMKLSRIAQLVFVVFILLGSIAQAQTREEIRLANATAVLQELQRSADQNAPHWLLERAYAVAIIPSVIKVGLIIGGRGGSGVLSVRDAKGQWTNPVFIRLGGGSFGFQAGVQATDVLLVFTSRQGVDGIVGGKVTLGADASVAAGPVGRQTSAGTDIGFTAQVYAYSHSKGLFAGIALDGSALTIDHGANARYYQKPDVLASEIIAFNAPAAPASGQAFIAELNQILNAPRASVSSSNAPAAKNVTSSDATSTNNVSAKPADPTELTTHPMEDSHPGAEPPQ